MKTYHMKRTVCILLPALLSFTAFSQTWIRVEDVTKHKGHTINLVGIVTYVNYVTDKLSYITLSGFSEEEPLSIKLIVKNADRSGINQITETSYLNQYLQVNGKIEMYRSKPQIVISGKSQISVVLEPRKHDDWEPL